MKNVGTLKKSFVGIAAAFTALSLASCSSAGNTSSGDEVSLTKVKMMTDVAFLPKHAPFFSALEQGFFKQEGIDLEILPGTGSNNTVVAVDTGKVDFGWADFGVTVLNQGKGVEVKQIALVQGTSAYATVTTAKSGIKTWEDLKGKTVATEGGGAMTAMWPLAMERIGFKEGDVKVVHAASEAKIPGLLAGQWDANLALFVSDAPVLVGQGEEPTVLKWSELGISLYGNGIIAADDTIKNDPELTKAFTRAVTQGFLWACANQDLAAKDLSKHVSGFDDAVVQTALEGQCSLVWTDENEAQGYGTMSDEGVDKTIAIAAEFLGLENADGLKAADVYTNELVEPIQKDTVVRSPQE